MSIDDQILPYLRSYVAGPMQVNFTGATIKKLLGGDYNYNYHVRIAGHDFLVRLNIEPQSGLDTQIEYEYATLEYLKPLAIAPKPLFLDNTKKHLPYGLLIEEYISGKHLEFSVDSVRRTATTMAQLHTLPIKDSPFRIRNNPFRQQFESIRDDLEKYKQRQRVHPDLIRVAGDVIARISKELPDLEHLYTPRSIVHTDPNPANIIDNGEKAYLIDWEQGRIDDPSYDIGAFFTEALNLWVSSRTLSDAEKNAFLDTYTSQTKDSTIADRAKPRTILHSLGCATWAANRIADVDEGKIDPNLGAQNYSRYQATASPDLLEKALST